jgi:diaminobutyrate-2-oxoglutarate transaminase
VEAALKLARKHTGRRLIVSFTNSFHGMTLGALAVSAGSGYQASAGAALAETAQVAYDRPEPSGPDLADALAAISRDAGIPAAVIVETVQGEGGLAAAHMDWLRHLEAYCRQHGVLLIVDDVQMGCGRTGSFFSFEPAGIKPDLVCLSKSLSGYGLPCTVLLIRGDLDAWEPGEHSATFRGVNPAFVTATAALDLWREGSGLEAAIAQQARLARDQLDRLAGAFPGVVAGVRGRGLALGLVMRSAAAAGAVCRGAFENGLLIERSGRGHEVVKLFPPLTVSEDELGAGLATLEKSLAEVS